MPTITKPAQELLDCIDDAIELETDSGKHDCHTTRYVFEFDGKKYAAWLTFSYEDGCQDEGDVTLYEVEPVQVMITEWQAVK